MIPFNVLDLVYSQTVSWVGLYYCPLLPLIGTVTLTATFYIKKVVVVCQFLSVGVTMKQLFGHLKLEKIISMSRVHTLLLPNTATYNIVVFHNISRLVVCCASFVPTVFVTTNLPA